MGNLIVSLLVGLVTGVILRLLNFGWGATLVPAVLITLGSLVFLGRRVAQKVSGVIAKAHAEIQSAGNNPKEIRNRVEKAVRTMESALPYGRWQFLVGSEINAQIGMLKYMVQDYEGALAAFNQNQSRNFMAWALKGAIHHRAKAYDQMRAAFEKSVQFGKKETITWAVYAWCEFQRGQKEQALSILSRAVVANPADEGLKNAHLALQNNKRIKMKAWEPMWWQFALESPPSQQPQRQVRFARR